MEVERNSFITSHRVNVGEPVHSHDSKVLFDSEEENDWDREDQLSDEDHLLSSDDATQDGFSDEEVDPFNLDEDEEEDSLGRYESKVLSGTATRDQKEREQQQMGDENFEPNEIINSIKKAEGSKVLGGPATRDQKERKQHHMEDVNFEANDIINSIKKAEGNKGLECMLHACDSNEVVGKAEPSKKMSVNGLITDFF
ncbi:hypothetical protein L2E82_44678 [Cichorium intybus]|uniref:Uncharacterized protein n=1 Tax=Cichorium intybus TaxID=13427 RepID=A0ACB8ZR02_CICIN|nr:hypothetical protein L2E82_44678 [Cichorium intybus]